MHAHTHIDNNTLYLDKKCNSITFLLLLLYIYYYYYYNKKRKSLYLSLYEHIIDICKLLQSSIQDEIANFNLNIFLITFLTDIS